jgi:hypothetical protein
MSFTINKALLAVLGVATTWSLFVVAGLPLTTVDDLYFVGIADSWRSTGLLASRLMTPEYLEGFSSPAFYFHPPIYPAILASWLTIWPNSELSLQTFAFTSLLIGVAGILMICRYFSVSFISCLVVCLVFVIGFSRLGLRPEVLAVSSLLFGTGLLLRYEPALTVFAFLTYGLSILCYPFTAPAAVAFTLYAFWMWPERNRNKSIVFISFGLFAILLWAFLSLMLIDWKVQEFLASYRLTIDVVNPGAMFSPARYLEYLGKLSTDSKFLPKWPFVLIGPSLLIWATIFRKSSFELLNFCWAFTFGVIGAAGMAHLRAVDLSVFYSLAVTAILLDQMLRSRMLRLLGQLSVLGLTLVANIAVVISLTLQSSIDEQEIIEVRDKAAAVPLSQSILVDSAVARHVFNWQLGPNFYDFRTSRKLLAAHGTNIYPRYISDIRDSEVWIVGRDFSYSTDAPGLDRRPATFFGLSMGSVSRLDCDPLFITSKNGISPAE